MTELLLKNFAMHVSLTGEEFGYLAAHFNRQSIKNKTVLLRAGETCRRVYFVNAGCLRIYYTDADGEEHNVLFLPENWWATDIGSFSMQRPAQFSLEAIEDSDCFYLDFERLEALYTRIPTLERFFRILSQNGFHLLERRITSYLSKSALERYTLFRKLYPDLETRISQKHIASYLGITPVFLSRLRQQI
jgi:CRP-like cAMP-binding protein